MIDPATDERRNYRTICDVSGAGDLLDTLVSRLAPGGEIVLAGFYDEPLSFTFPPAFMREARFRIAAQWHENDLKAVREMAESGRLSLDGGRVDHRIALCATATIGIGFPHRGRRTGGDSQARQHAAKHAVADDQVGLARTFD